MHRPSDEATRAWRQRPRPASGSGAEGADDAGVDEDEQRLGDERPEGRHGEAEDLAQRSRLGRAAHGGGAVTAPCSPTRPSCRGSHPAPDPVAGSLPRPRIPTTTVPAGCATLEASFQGHAVRRRRLRRATARLHAARGVHQPDTGRTFFPPQAVDGIVAGQRANPEITRGLSHGCPHPCHPCLGAFPRSVPRSVHRLPWSGGRCPLGSREAPVGPPA